MIDHPPRPDGPVLRLWSRIPPRLFGGRVRTTTMLLVIVFVGAAFLYGDRSEYYGNLDREAKLSEIADVRSTTSAPASEPEETRESTTDVNTTTTAQLRPSTTTGLGEDGPGFSGDPRVPEPTLTGEVPTVSVTATTTASDR